MDFWKRYKNKFLIGSGVLALLTASVYGILQFEESRLKKLQVNAEERIYVAAKNLPPKGIKLENKKKASEIIKEKEELQEDLEEVKKI